MGFEPTLPLKKLGEDKSEPEISQESCESSQSTVTEEVKKISEEPFLLVHMENKGGTKSVDTVCDSESYKDDVAEAVTPKADILELMVSSESLDDYLSTGCQTPRESIFDPFAPGPEEVICAPRKNVIRGAEVLSRRQLNFESGDYPVTRLSFNLDDAEEESFDLDDAEEEGQYLLVLENMILGLIMPEGFLNSPEKTETTTIDLSTHEICKTPDSKPLLTGIASTCPRAPMRTSLKAFKLSLSICRKIDFDSISDSVYDGSSVVHDNN